MGRYKGVNMAMVSWASILLASTLTLVGCAGSYPGIAPTSPYYGDTYNAPPPQYPYAGPWVGPNTPWVFYQGDWFLNGMLYYFYGQRGWAPYYAYPPTYIVRQVYWYEPKWNTWYQQHPQYVQTFSQRYPYWRSHHYGQRYDQNFYNRYHPGQGGGWQKGFHGSVTERPAGRRQAPGQMPPPEGRRPGPYQGTHPSQVAPPERRRPLPGQVTQPEGRGQGPAQATPYQKPKPAPAQQQQPRQREQHQQQQIQHQQQQKQQQPQRQIQRAPQPQQQQQRQQHQRQQQQQEKKAPQQPTQP
jgi:hypothetical protein